MIKFQNVRFFLSDSNGIMLARGAVHNPNIFKEIKTHILNKGENNGEKGGNDFLNKGENLELVLNENLDKELKNDYIELSNICSINEKNIENENNNIHNEEDKCLLNKKKKNSKNEEDSENDVKQSKNLAKIFEIKYGNKIIDIIPIIKEFAQIARNLDYSIQNTKYNCLYILKTHKNHLNLFQKIQKIKTYDDLEKALEINENDKNEKYSNNQYNDIEIKTKKFIKETKKDSI